MLDNTPMTNSEQPNNPLHGITLSFIVEDLVERHGWDALYEIVPIRCFQNNPSVKSTLKFLRKTEWARTKVEKVYLSDLRDLRIKARNAKRNRRRKELRARGHPPEGGGVAPPTPPVAGSDQPPKPEST